MSMISEQVKELRLAAAYKEHSMRELLEKAADTIEALSKKTDEQNELDIGEIYKQLNESKETIRRAKAGEYVSEAKLARQLDCAIDIIESISAKLQTANMERSADCKMIDGKKLLEDLEKEVFTADLYEHGWDGQTVDNLLCLGDVKKVIDGYEP